MLQAHQLDQAFPNGSSSMVHRYTRIAMGKNTAMDVVTGESSGTSGQLLLLYPLLFSKCTPISLLKWPTLLQA